MKNWYENKRDFHHLQWEKAQEDNKPEAVKHHMREYINYSELCDINANLYNPSHQDQQ